VPHEVPSLTLPAGVQTGDPVMHAIVAFWHEPASVQSVPTAHATHVPSAQTAPASQLVPSSALPVCSQLSAPPSHANTPDWQLAGVQVIPTVPHAPSLDGPASAALSGPIASGGPPSPMAVPSRPASAPPPGPSLKSPRRDVHPAPIVNAPMTAAMRKVREERNIRSSA
jgi:hypothetical protein